MRDLYMVSAYERSRTSGSFCVNLHNPYTCVCVCVGSWSLQFERGSTVCVIRSLLWLGLISFHVPMTPQHGYIYMGDGLKNLDLPFML